MSIITLNTEDLDHRQNHLLLLSIVVPRPIGLISTISKDGKANLAPYSFFQAISANPPAILFCPIRNRHAEPKDSHINAEQTGEFVAAVVTEEMAEPMNLASVEFPHGISEFEKAGFTAKPAEIVKPSLVGESPVNMECEVFKIVEMDNKPLSGAIVIGKVVRVHIREDMFDAEKNVVKEDGYNLISRLGGSGYAPIREIFEMSRPMLMPEGDPVKGSHLKK